MVGATRSFGMSSNASFGSISNRMSFSTSDRKEQTRAQVKLDERTKNYE